MHVYSTELGIWLSFVKTLEFFWVEVGGLEPQTPPRYATAYRVNLAVCAICDFFSVVGLLVIERTTFVLHIDR
jgi:hypothetical protein